LLLDSGQHPFEGQYPPFFYPRIFMLPPSAPESRFLLCPFNFLTTKLLGDL